MGTLREQCSNSVVVASADREEQHDRVLELTVAGGRAEEKAPAAMGRSSFKCRRADSPRFFAAETLMPKCSATPA